MSQLDPFKIPEGFVVCDAEGYYVDLGEGSSTRGWLYRMGEGGLYTVRKMSEEEIARVRTIAAGREMIKKLAPDVESAPLTGGVDHLMDKPIPDAPDMAQLRHDQFLAGAEAFKNELRSATKSVLWPHIDGVYAVFLQKQKGKSNDAGS